MSFCLTKNVPFWYTAFLLLAALLTFQTSGAILEWDSTGEPQVAGYKAYIGMESRSYVRVLDTKLQTWVTLTGLDAGTTYFLAATAYDADGLESDFSDEIPYTPRVDGVTSVFLPFNFEFMPDGVVLRMSGQPGQRCWVVASSDLKIWQQVRAFTFSDSSIVEISDPAAMTSPMRFYRVIASKQ
jgi:hypothetical protein